MSDVVKINPDGKNELPKCPHCGKPIGEMRYFTAVWTVTVNYIFACPHCLRTLGIGTK